MEKTYLFYDLETSGLNKCFDQVLQFAAIRTTLDLEELERHEISIKLNKDTIPSPEAFLTHQISIEENKKGLSELEGISKIHSLMNTVGTLSLGYNTLGFDDEFLRFSFYKNLLTPYTHQFAHGCGRLDLLPIVVLYFLFQKNALNWPNLNGKPTLKLEYLNRENKFIKGRAHDAMVDVEATLALARRLSKCKKTWEYAIGYFDKAEEERRLAKLPRAFQYYQEALILSPKFSKQNFQTVAINLGQHRHYKNQTIWLRLDNADLSKTTINTIEENTWVLHKKTAGEMFYLPAIERFTQFFDTMACEIVEANKRWLEENPDIFKVIIDYHLNYKYPEVLDIDVDAALYSMGFLSNEEKQLCSDFHMVGMDEKIKMIPLFYRYELQAQVIRLLGRHFYEELPDFYQNIFDIYLRNLNKKDNAFDYKGNPRKTPDEMLLEIISLKNKYQKESNKIELLEDLEYYIRKEFQRWL